MVEIRVISKNGRIDFWLVGNLPLCTFTEVPLYHATRVPETRSFRPVTQNQGFSKKLTGFGRCGEAVSAAPLVQLLPLSHGISTICPVPGLAEG